MNALSSDNFADFWEILTGVIDDNKAKIIRFSCFALLIIGALWAVFNYIRADMLADTETNTFGSSHYVQDDGGAALKRMADLAQTVQDMRQGGMAIADSIVLAHTKPFNIDGYTESGLENLGRGTSSTAAAISSDVQPAVQNVEEAEPEIFVRAVMMTGDTRAAVLDLAEEKGWMVRRGTELPNGFGRVTNITTNKVVIRRNRKNYEYRLEKIETDLQRKLSGKGSSKNNNQNSSNNKQIGVEKFLFEGTVPDDSPLGTSVKEEALKK